MIYTFLCNLMMFPLKLLGIAVDEKSFTQTLVNVHCGTVSPIWSVVSLYSELSSTCMIETDPLLLRS